MAQGDITKVEKDAVVDLATKDVSYVEETFIEGENSELHIIDRDTIIIGLKDTNKSEHPDIHRMISEHLLATDYVLASDYPDGVLSTTIGGINIDDPALGVITYEEISNITDDGVTYTISVTDIEIVPAFPSNFGGYSYTDQSALPELIQMVTSLMWTTEVSNAYIASQPENNV